MQNISVGRPYNLDTVITPFGIVSHLILWVALALIGGSALGLTTVEAVLGGLAGTVIFFVSELIHQLGHAWAARRAG